MDPYKTLDITPGASEKEIKAAFKKLAKKHHPDVGGDEQKFKEINEAYSLLTDKKEQSPIGGGRPGFDFGLHDIFNETVFDMMFRQGRNITRLQVDPELLIKGGQFDFQFQAFENRNGRLFPVMKNVTLRVEPDTPAGVQIAIPGTQPNHSFIQLVPGNTDKYRVSELLHLTEIQTISVFKAMVGGNHEVTTPSGKTISIKIPSGTQPGTIHRIRMCGLRQPNGMRGDYNVQFMISIPSIEGKDEKELQEKLLVGLTEGLK